MLDFGFYNMDCMEGMKEFPDDYFNLTIVDVEYGIGQGGHSNHTRGKLAISKNYHSFKDDKSPDENYFKELFRISRNQIVWGANHFISKISKDSSCWIVWDKENGATDFADCELAWSSFKTAVRIFRFQWQGMLRKRENGYKESRVHPCQKPVALYRWLLQNYAKQGDKILDTHVGSASSLIAFEQEGFDYVGMELDEDYYRDATKRLKRSRIATIDMFKKPKMKTVKQETLGLLTT